MYEKKIFGIYNRELWMGMAVYVVLLVASITLGRGMQAGLLRTLFLISPVIGVILICRAVIRHVRRVDEFIRMEMLESIAIAAVLTAGITFTYGFLETLGLPKLSMFCVLPLLGGLLAILACARKFQSHE